MINDMSKYADNLGLAYQIADDILDVVGNPEELGKATGSDEKKHKKHIYFHKWCCCSPSEASRTHIGGSQRYSRLL